MWLRNIEECNSYKKDKDCSIVYRTRAGFMKVVTGFDFPGRSLYTKCMNDISDVISFSLNSSLVLLDFNGNQSVPINSIRVFSEEKGKLWVRKQCKYSRVFEDPSSTIIYNTESGTTVLRGFDYIGEDVRCFVCEDLESAKAWDVREGLEWN